MIVYKDNYTIIKLKTLSSLVVLFVSLFVWSGIFGPRPQPYLYSEEILMEKYIKTEDSISLQNE